MVLSLPNTQTLNTVPHIVVTPPTINLLVLILHNCTSATVMNHKASICYVEYLICDRVETHRLRTTALRASAEVMSSQLNLSAED